METALFSLFLLMFDTPHIVLGIVVFLTAILLFTYFYQKHRKFKSIDVKRVISLMRKTNFFNDMVAKLHSPQKRELTIAEKRDLVQTTNNTIPQYTARLRNKYPQLTDSDILFCCFHFFGFHIDELALITARTTSSIRKREDSILKKMNLDKKAHFIDAIIDV
jgi:hypothetical protein